MALLTGDDQLESASQRPAFPKFDYPQQNALRVTQLTTESLVVESFGWIRSQSTVPIPETDSDSSTIIFPLM
jgi:hypothetical protein